MIAVPPVPEAKETEWLTGMSPPSERESTQLLSLMRKDLSPRYEIQQYLNRGGFATVWEGLDTFTNEPVAIKRFHKQTRGRNDFYREIRAMFKLSHPRIVRIINLMENSEGDRYLIMELCRGESLRKRISLARRAGRRLPIERVLQAIRQIAEGLNAAHSVGLVHRDLKPENIMLTQPDQKPLDGLPIKITDFGLTRGASAVDADGAMKLIALSGSPAYMAPEQFQQAFGPASDMYSLGVIFYELLHNQMPFEGTAEALARQHFYEKPAIDASLPQEFRTLLASLLDKQPQNRPNARDVFRQLDSLADLIRPQITPSRTEAKAPGESHMLASSRLATPALGLYYWPGPANHSTDTKAPGQETKPNPTGEWWIPSPEGFWRYRGTDGRYSNFVPQTGVQSTQLDDRTLWFFAVNQLYRWSGEDKTQCLGYLPDWESPDPERVWHVHNGRLILGDRDRIHEFDVAGDSPQLVAKYPLRSDLRLTQVMKNEDGTIWATFFGKRPNLLRINTLDKSRQGYELPGFCTKLDFCPRSQKLCAILSVDDTRSFYTFTEKDKVWQSIGTTDGFVSWVRLSDLPAGQTGYVLNGQGEVQLLKNDGFEPVLRFRKQPALYNYLATDGNRFAVIGRTETEWWFELRQQGSGKPVESVA